MRTTVEERDSRGRELTQSGERSEKGLWAAGWALAGTGAWAGIAVLARLGVARIGMIELMFLFGPLVIAPLGMELGRVGGSGLPAGRRFAAMAQILQPVGAVLAVAAICLAPGGVRTGILAGGWAAVCGLAGVGGVVELGLVVFGSDAVDRKLTGSSRHTRPGFSDQNLIFPEHKAAGFLDQNRTAEAAVATRLVVAAGAIASLDLAVGGAWLVASRLGWRPLGIQEPIGLLTAVHFHFAGFATALIAGATLRFAEGRAAGHDILLRWLRRVVVLVLGLPFVVAAGFLISAELRMGAAVLFSLSVAGLAGLVWWCSGYLESAEARGMLRVASGAVFLGMGLSGTYAVGNFLGSDWLTIPRMASTHGVVNAAFCLCGLLGWLVEGTGAIDRIEGKSL